MLCVIACVSCARPVDKRIVEQPIVPAPAGTPSSVIPSGIPVPADEANPPLVGVRTVSFPTTDNLRLVGELFGDDGHRTLGVLLLHPSTQDMSVWYPFAQRLKGLGYAALAFDFRGYGQSRGTREVAKYPDDVAAALDVFAAMGIERAVVVGEEVGGTAATVGLSTKTGLVKGFVAVSSSPAFGSLDATSAARSFRIPALVIAPDSSRLAGLIPNAAFARIAQGVDRTDTGPLYDAIVRFLRKQLGT